MLISMLESLNEADGLLNAATNRSIVNLYRAYLSLAIDDEQATEGSSIELILFSLYQNAIAMGNVFRDISQEREIEFADTSLSSGGPCPCQMSEVGICGDA